jgi:hypothetical protein
MALYWNQKLMHLQVATDIQGSTDSNLTLIQNKDINRIDEVPRCNVIYIKLVNGFPTEMTQEEKDVADENYKQFLRDTKIEAIKLEAQRRVLEENHGDEIGIGFLGMTEHDQRNAIAQCLSILKAAVDAIHGMDVLTVLPQQYQDIYNGIYNAWTIVIQIRGLSDAIEAEVIAAETIEDIIAVKVEDNPLWIV